MADKFPALETIDNDIPTTGSTEDVGASDFLSREKELVGDEFKTEQDKEVLADSDDDINDFKEQFPEVEEAVPVEEQVVSDDDENYGLNISSKEIKFEGESKHLKEWRERRDLEISEREKANANKKQDIIAKAQQTIDDFYDNYNNKREQLSKQVLEEQEQFLEKRDGFLKRGTLWDRVNELVNGVGELTESENRDKTRFKNLLAKLKDKENVPGAGGY